MAFDGITVSALVAEIDDNLKGGRINKIAQPENDELLITGKGANGQRRLLLSASASLPLIYFTDKNRISPLTAPNFCMLLRKHIGSARILDVKQPGMERVVEFELEHLNELGDPCRKRLIMELMGKHSNIIFCDEKGMILDSIKHVSSLPIQKPDLVAPGVSITAPSPGGSYTTVTGTSFAAPFVSGSAALLMEWGIVRGNDPFLYGEKVKAYLRRGAQSVGGYGEYPNVEVGWGRLCVGKSIP